MLIKAWIILEVIICGLFFDYVVRCFSDMNKITYWNSIKRITKGLGKLFIDRIRGNNG